MENPRLKLSDRVTIPMAMHPLFRVEKAIQDGVEKNLLFRVWGGIGDMVCTEPTLRYALKMFKGCNISLACEAPELFTHLKFHKVFDLRTEKPLYENYLLFDTITPPDDSNMVWLFFSHMLTNCVDFPSMCALRLQLPVAEKEIQLLGKEPNDLPDAIRFAALNGVAVHPGRHWQSKTFPKHFWDTILAGLKARKITPIIIGGDADDNRGTVNVETDDCIDLRGKLTLPESVWLLQKAAVLLTNDSAPLHMAASGKAHIGYLATCKHYDLITHWRNGQWQWREKNFSKGGIWDTVDFCPNKGEKVEAEFVDPELLKSWLPDPYSMSDWAADMRQKKRYEEGFA